MADQREYQRLVDEVAALLGTPATLEDRDFALVAFAAHEGETAADDVRARSILSRTSSPQVKAWFESFGITRATGPVRIPPDPATGVRGRVCLPARHLGVTYGYIWLLDPDGAEWPPADLDAAFALAGRAGDLLAQEVQAGAELGERLRELLRTASGMAATADAADRSAGAAGTAAVAQPSDAVARAAAAALAAAASGVGGPSARYALIVVHDTPDNLPDASTVHAMPDVIACYTDQEGDKAELVALVRTARAPAEAARRITKGKRGARAGVSAWDAELSSTARMLGEARAAARTAAAFPERAPVASWPELGPFRLLSALPGTPDPAVAPLFAPRHAELARTAETYLDHAAHATRAAEELAIHRQTLYYRLSRVEQLTGLSLGHGEHRLLLHMALKAARLHRGGSS
ncbi:PucR family transcriptional regulator [Yinghuangia sp. YIM S09857]|uniref:PucR family transcriptional regulator n=1 Tax=Yinghuangia sp. YIM S09857 TaxID=3436929 RepID=UPI003F534C0C